MIKIIDLSIQAALINSPKILISKTINMVTDYLKKHKTKQRLLKYQKMYQFKKIYYKLNCCNE